NWRDPPHPCRIRQLIAQQVCEHRIECDHRNAQDQHDPKQTAELSDMVSVVPVAVSGVPTVGFVLGLVMMLMTGVVRVAFMADMVGVFIVVMRVVVRSWRMLVAHAGFLLLQWGLD